MQWTYMLPILIERTLCQNFCLIISDFFLFLWIPSACPSVICSDSLFVFPTISPPLSSSLPLLILFHLYFLPLRITISFSLSLSLFLSDPWHSQYSDERLPNTVQCDQVLLSKQDWQPIFSGQLNAVLLQCHVLVPWATPLDWTLLHSPYYTSADLISLLFLLIISFLLVILKVKGELFFQLQ